MYLKPKTEIEKTCVPTAMKLSHSHSVPGLLRLHTALVRGIRYSVCVLGLPLVCVCTEVWELRASIYDLVLTETN